MSYDGDRSSFTTAGNDDYSKRWESAEVLDMAGAERRCFDGYIQLLASRGRVQVCEKATGELLCERIFEPMESGRSYYLGGVLEDMVVYPAVLVTHLASHGYGLDIRVEDAPPVCVFWASSEPPASVAVPQHGEPRYFRPTIWRGGGLYRVSELHGIYALEYRLYSPGTHRMQWEAVGAGSDFLEALELLDSHRPEEAQLNTGLPMAEPIEGPSNPLLNVLSDTGPISEAEGSLSPQEIAWGRGEGL